MFVCIGLPILGPIIQFLKSPRPKQSNHIHK